MAMSKEQLALKRYTDATTWTTATKVEAAQVVEEQGPEAFVRWQFERRMMCAYETAVYRERMLDAPTWSELSEAEREGYRAAFDEQQQRLGEVARTLVRGDPVALATVGDRSNVIPFG